MNQNYSFIRNISLILLTALLLSACSAGKDDVYSKQDAIVDYGLLQTLPQSPISYEDEVRPILENRCVVCHGCYDAPCQLKLTSVEGVRRGANPEKVYDGARIKAVEPTRLGIDAKTTEAWRTRGFYSVLNETPAASGDSPEDNLRNSVLYQMLRLKQLHPQPRMGMLPATFDISLGRQQTCTNIDEFSKFTADTPLWGMPFAMPNLNDDEYGTLVQWVAQGAPASPQVESSAQAKIQIDKWEQFLNGSSNKERLTSRYIYEHLFLGHMHFAGTPDREFYRLVRSRTAPGEPIDEIATTRPFDYPGTDTFYYRLRKHDSSIVAKSHVVYELSDQRLARFKELFLDPAYTVDALPSYDPQLSANPFATFEPIPATSRYKFMLDDSRYFIEGFIKGPVCRGQVALNVIADHFWVVFLNPDKNAFSQSPEFMRAVAETLEPPNADVNSFKLLSTFTSYKKNQQAYMDLRDNHLAKMETTDIRNAIEYIWDGDGVNPNAGLTIYRHFDSASVMNGLVGHYPETSWIIDYPLFERIHYLLVAGFDVYGNVGHQLNSRLYMDFLRMEGEDTFLFFLPVEVRTKIRDSWYEGIREKRASVLAEHKTWATTKSVKGYRTDDPQREFYQYIGNRLGALGMPPDSLDRCAPNPCDIANATLADRSMAKLSSAKGESLIAFPDIALVRIGGQDSQPDETFSIILNKDYKDLTSIFSDEDKRDRSGDTLDVSRGIVGSYPNFFFDVDSEDLDRFVTGMSQVKTRKDYENMVALFGVRRTNARFWQAADWFQASYAAQEPVESGILDLNRYQDR